MARDTVDLKGKKFDVSFTRYSMCFYLILTERWKREKEIAYSTWHGKGRANIITRQQ